MIHLLILVLVLVGIVVCCSYLLGYRLGSESRAAELQRIRLDASRAQHEIHRLTATAFAALADEVVRRRSR